MNDNQKTADLKGSFRANVSEWNDHTYSIEQLKSPLIIGADEEEIGQYQPSYHPAPRYRA